MEQPRNKLLDPVPWIVFAWVIGILTSAFFYLNAKIAKADESREQILVQLSSIQSDLKNLEYLIKSK